MSLLLAHLVHALHFTHGGIVMEDWPGPLHRRVASVRG
jgi:hypothetical protein